MLAWDGSSRRWGELRPPTHADVPSPVLLEHVSTFEIICMQTKKVDYMSCTLSEIASSYPSQLK